MKISYKLMFIVLLTIIEISITLLSVFEISKGATLHKLNSLHLKNSIIFTRQVSDFTGNSTAEIQVQINAMEKTVVEIKQQPLDCLDLVNSLNIIIMKAIGTYQAYELCIKDIEDVNEALSYIEDFRQGSIDKAVFLNQMQRSARIFADNSALFEKPITETVNFLLKVFIPLVVVISLFNILFITFLSRTISESIDKVIRVLKRKDSTLSEDQIYATATGELRELLVVASERARETVIQEEITEKLEALVLKRTELLSHANDELSKFAYRTSHDLKGPVSASKTLAQFIQQDIDSGELQDAKADAKKIEAQMQELEAHIAGILSLTKATEIQNTSDIISIRSLFLQRIEALKSHTQYEQVTLSLDVDERLFFEVNRVRLQQVIDNLMSNAIKYRDRTRASYLNIKAELTDNTLHLEFIDNGIGFPENKQDDAFDMFTRFHTSISSGSGMGLAIVKKHVDLMGGRIEIQSSDKKEVNGTTFRVILPANGKGVLGSNTIGEKSHE